MAIRICVYMAHSGYGDTAIEGMYDQLDSSIAQASMHGYRILSAGDWNACVWCKQFAEDNSAGLYSCGTRTGRSDWFAKQACSKELVICKDCA